MRRKVEDVMTTEVVTVRQHAPFKTIVRLLEERRISAVPVVDHAGVVVGVVSEADLLAKERYHMAATASTRWRGCGTGPRCTRPRGSSRPS